MTKDSEVINWNNTNPLKQNITDWMRQLWQRIQQHAKEEEERIKSGEYEYVATHLMSKELWEVVANPETPPDIVHRILMATFTGYQWVKKDTSNIAIDEKLDNL